MADEKEAKKEKERKSDPDRPVRPSEPSPPDVAPYGGVHKAIRTPAYLLAQATYWETGMVAYAKAVATHLRALAAYIERRNKEKAEKPLARTESALAKLAKKEEKAKALQQSILEDRKKLEALSKGTPPPPKQ